MLNPEFARAELIQWAEVTRGWVRDAPGAFVLDACCAATGKIFSDGFFPMEKAVSEIEMVYCTHCADWHWLEIRNEPVQRRPVRLVPDQPSALVGG